MDAADEEDKRLRSAALQNASAILLVRQRAEQDLREAKEALERKTEELAQLVRHDAGDTGVHDGRGFS